MLDRLSSFNLHTMASIYPWLSICGLILTFLMLETIQSIELKHTVVDFS